MENLKNYNEFITEDKSIDKFGYTGVDITDDLKSNFRSWENDCDNEKDANSLFSTLMTRHPDLDPEKVREIAYDWVGYEPKGEE